MQIQAEKALKIVTESSASAIMVVMLTQVEAELEDNEWMIDYLSSCLSSSDHVGRSLMMSLVICCYQG